MFSQKYPVESLAKNIIYVLLVSTLSIDQTQLLFEITCLSIQVNIHIFFFAELTMSLKNTTVFAGKSGIIEATAELVIKDFVDVMAGFKPGRFIDSDTFMLGGIPLKIRVYPNGYTDSDKGFESHLKLW